MRRHFFFILSVVVATGSVIQAQATGRPADVVPGQYLVKWKNGSSFAAQALTARLGMQELRRHHGSLEGLVTYQTSTVMDPTPLLTELNNHPMVEFAQPNEIIASLHAREGVRYPFSLQGLTFMAPPPLNPRPDEPASAMDPQLAQNYGIAQVKAPPAWVVTRGSTEIIVGVIDSGIDYNHEDLSFNMWRNPEPSELGDVVGYDSLRHNGLPYDDDEMHGHGTHAAGIIGAVGRNGIGLSGVSQRVSLMALKAFSAYGFGTTESVVAAIEYAVDHGARILSCSWAGGRRDNPAFLAAIEKARSKGVLMVVAAGNSAADNDNDATAAYPAGYRIDNIVAVANVDSTDRLYRSSNFGKETVLLGAPGVSIYSTFPGGNRYAWDTGTSIACPFVAGAAALLWAGHPDWTYLQVREALAQSADPVPGLAGKTITGGRLNVDRAMKVRF